jgi:hypothetical protein
MYNKVWVLFIEEVKPWCLRHVLIRTGGVLVFLRHVLIRTDDVLVFLCHVSACLGVFVRV